MKTLTEIVEVAMHLIPMGMTIVGALAFVVSVITQVVKEVGVVSKFPTDILVIILSIVLTMIAAVAYADYCGIVLAWYMFVGTFIGGFFVAFVAMFGWDKISELYKRYKK